MRRGAIGSATAGMRHLPLEERGSKGLLEHTDGCDPHEKAGMGPAGGDPRW